MERVHQVYFPKSGFEPDSYGPLLMLEHPIFHNKLRIFYQDFKQLYVLVLTLFYYTNFQNI